MLLTSEELYFHIYIYIYIFNDVPLRFEETYCFAKRKKLVRAIGTGSKITEK